MKSLCTIIKLLLIPILSLAGPEVPQYGHLIWKADFSNADQWDTREHWGNIHPEYPDYINTPDMVFVRNGELVVGQQKQKSGKIHVGKAVSKEVFHHGIFKFVVRLPEDKNLWAAIWFTGHYSWPPEIDLLEAYSNKKGKWRLTTNVHYSTVSKVHNVAGVKRHRIPDVTGRYVEYVLDWQEDYIRMYADGKLVREITDPVVMAGFKVPMHIIINNGSTSMDIEDYTELIVKSVEVYRKEY